MLTDRQINQMMVKLKRFEATLDRLLFEKADVISMSAFRTDGKYHTIPENDNFTPCHENDSWEGEGTYCWFIGQYTVPAQLKGKTLYIYPKIDAYEGLLWVNQKPFGNFSSKTKENDHGIHYCDMLKQNVRENEIINIALEYYAHHYVIGTRPLETNMDKDFRITYHEVDVCIKNEDIWDFYFNLKIADQMVDALDDSSFRRAQVIQTLKRVHEIIYYDYESVDRILFLNAIKKANLLLKDILMEKNAASAPYAGLIGHSHMDTAWLWEIKETVKKCARTYSNQINLMEQYPEYKFFQSSAYHSLMMKENYPELFENIREMAAAGRYEPNGGVFVECDCNITSGESLIRQFLWGQRFTRENFNYTSDCFWLPDTFGYSASIPQIMKGCGVKYFLTTKLSWCDTTEFPYDTFYWKGIDGTRVLVHFNKMLASPDPKNMMEFLVNGGQNSIKEKTVSNMRLISYGVGDGGGGPSFENIEMTKRLGDVEGLPRSGYTTVSDFMKRLENTIVDPSTYTGELYLELHRGTLTNQHTIKKNNRLAEIELRNLEYVTVRNAIKREIVASDSNIHPLMKKLLVNQFHDILPGTCITKAHEQSIRETSNIIEQAQSLIYTILKPDKQENIISVLNTLSFDRKDVLYLDCPDGFIAAGGYKQQVITDLLGNKKLAVSAAIPAFSGIELKKVPGKLTEASAFERTGNTLSTPFFKAEFDAKGYMTSLVDKRVNRELKGEGYALNTFLIAEDVPSDWDNWDFDADCETKFRDTAALISSSVISDGEVEYRIRNKYQITQKSTLLQDMIFYADSPEIRFDTIMDWQDDHRFLKTAFDTSIQTDFARQEIQYGYIKRSTSRSTEAEKAKFEVCNHKYTDLSETRYGAAVMNDCKYGISVKESQIRLSLHKGGCRPDNKGDKGLHACCYSFYPHTDGFGAGSVIKPAYMLNIKPIYINGGFKEDSLLKVSADNVIAEAVKPLEDNEKAFILRLYEAEGTYTNTKISFSFPVKAVAVTNMLEEVIEEREAKQEIDLVFHAFEIMTIKVSY